MKGNMNIHPQRVKNLNKVTGRKRKMTGSLKISNVMLKSGRRRGKMDVAIGGMLWGITSTVKGKNTLLWRFWKEASGSSRVSGTQAVFNLCCSHTPRNNRELVTLLHYAWRGTQSFVFIKIIIINPVSISYIFSFVTQEIHYKLLLVSFIIM